MARYISLL